MADDVEKQEVQLTPEETEASKKGWVSKDTWVANGSDEGDHVSAAMFLARGQFIGDQKRDREEISALRSQVGKFTQFMTDEKKASYERGLKEAEDKHAKALTDGDDEGAKAALEDIKNLDRNTVPEVDPFETWVSQNDWYKGDPELFTFANEMDRFVHMQGGGGNIADVGAHMDKVKALVQDKFPEKFGNPHRNDPPSDSSAKGRTMETKPADVTLADLPEQMQVRCKQFVENGHGTEKDYIKVLINTGDIRVEG